MIGVLDRRRALRSRADGLYRRLVDQARDPVFYALCGVPDTLDGRFDMIVLHVSLVVRRLRAGEIAEKALAQMLFDTMMDDMDRSLREMGVGDLGVGRRVKAMAKAFYGRATAYDAALDEGADALTAALERNLFAAARARPEQMRRVVDYARDWAALLERTPNATLAGGEIPFASLPSADDK